MTSWNGPILAALFAGALSACTNIAEGPARGPAAGATELAEAAAAGAAGAGEATDVAAIPLDDMARADLASEGEDLGDPDIELDFDQVREDFSVLRRSDIPEDVLAQLDQLSAERLISKSVIGDDDTRVPVTDTRVTPHRAIVKLYTQFVAGGSFYGCSGSLIAPDAVLTAAPLRSPRAIIA